MILKSLWVCWTVIKILRAIELARFEASKVNQIGIGLSRQLLNEKLQKEQPTELMISLSFWVLLILTLLEVVWI